MSLINRLTNIKVMEVSVVDKPANKKTFAVIKRDEKGKLELLQKAENGDIESIKEIIKVLFANLSDEVLLELGLKRVQEQEDKKIEPEEETEKTVEYERIINDLRADFENQINDLQSKLSNISKSIVNTQINGIENTEEQVIKNVTGMASIGLNKIK